MPEKWAKKLDRKLDKTKHAKMPRKKAPVKFKYTVRKKDKDGTPLDLFVVLPVPGLKNPVWRICRDETQEGVNKVIAQIKAAREKELLDAAPPESCAKFFDFWLDLVRPRVTERTFAGYKNYVDNYLRPALGELQIKNVRAIDIQRLYQQLSEKGFKPLSIKKTHTVASMIFKEAVGLELISQNPVTRAKPPKSTDLLKIKSMNAQEVARFLDECRKADHGVIFEFALETGMRPQEYLALRWTDIDLEKRTAEVSRALVTDRKGGGHYFKEPKTRRSRRTVTLSRQMCEKLCVHREKQNAYIKEIEERIRRHAKPSREYRKETNRQMLQNHIAFNLVFPAENFMPFKDRNLSKRYFKPIIDNAQIDKTFSVYHLRHTCATLLLSANVNPKIVSERLGHASISITLDTYSHVLPNMQQEATDSLSQILYKVV